MPAEASVLRLEERVEAFGVTDDNAFLRGVYTLTDQYAPAASQPCYRKEKPTDNGDVWLCADHTGFWSFGPGRDPADGVYVHSASSGLRQPTEAEAWKVWRGENWTIAESVVVAPELGTSCSHDELRVERTAAWMICGTLVMTLVALHLLRSRNALIRDYSYNLLSSTMVSLLGILILDSVNAFLFEQLLPAPPPRGFGFGLPISPAIQILVGSAIFAASYFCMIYLGWKFQFNRFRMAMLRTFFSSLIGWSFVFAWTNLQREAAKSFGDDVSDTLDVKGTPAQVTVAALVVLSAWLVFNIFQEASSGLRAEHFAEPPASPWPSLPEYAATSSGLPVLTSRGGKKIIWNEEVVEAETDVSVSSISVLTNQVLVYYMTGHMNGLPGRMSHHSLPEVTFWLWVALAAFVAALAVFRLRANGVCQGTNGAILQRVTVNSVGFCLWRAFNWTLKRQMSEADEPVVDVINAVVLSVVSVAVVVGLGQLTACMRPEAKGGLEMDPVEWAMKVVNRCVGMFVGISWSRSFDSAVSTITEETFANNPVIARLVISALFVALLLRPWYIHILPKAEMTEAEHAKAIEEEIARSKASS